MLSKEEIVNQLELLCQEDLYFFYCNYIAKDFRETLDAPHIDTLASYLSDLKNNTIKRLCVAMPPRHSKSSMVTLAFPLWLLTQDKNLNILIVNNSAGLSEKFGIQLREYIKRIGPEFNLYLSDVKHSSTYLMFTDKNGHLYNGSIRLVGASGSITGQDADYIILDDIYSGFEDITPTLLQKKIEWFNTIIEQRIEPHTRLVILHTRWHSNDLQGYLHENHPDDYTFLEFPAISEDDKPLWKERYTLEEYLKKKETMGERLFQAIYQQQPLDLTSDFFNMNNLHFGLPPNYNPTHYVRSWDIASGEDHSKSDYTAGVKMVKSGEYGIITDIVHGIFGNQTKNKIITTAELDTPETHICIETGVGGGAKLLYTEWKQQLKGYMLEEMTPVTSKVDRATPFSNAVHDGRVYINITDDELREALLQEMKQFSMSVHDDLVDAASYSWNYLFNTHSKTPKIEMVYL